MATAALRCDLAIGDLPIARRTTALTAQAQQPTRSRKNGHSRQPGRVFTRTKTPDSAAGAVMSSISIGELPKGRHFSISNSPNSLIPFVAAGTVWRCPLPTARAFHPFLGSCLGAEMKENRFPLAAIPGVDVIDHVHAEFCDYDGAAKLLKRNLAEEEQAAAEMQSASTKLSAELAGASTSDVAQRSLGAVVDQVREETYAAVGGVRSVGEQAVGRARKAVRKAERRGRTKMKGAKTTARSASSTVKRKAKKPVSRTRGASKGTGSTRNVSRPRGSSTTSRARTSSARKTTRPAARRKTTRPAAGRRTTRPAAPAKTTRSTARRTSR